MGVYDRKFLKPVAEALSSLGTVRSMVLHSEDGLDELSISAPTTVLHSTPEGIREETVDPEALGLSLALFSLWALFGVSFLMFGDALWLPLRSLGVPLEPIGPPLGWSLGSLGEFFSSSWPFW